jgi:hypothetical protein
VSLQIIGGILAPVSHDGSRADDSVYGVDANGFYMGLVSATVAVSVANRPPPPRGRFKWNGSTWLRFIEIEEQVRLIEQQRDDRIAAGFTLANIDWAADNTFRTVLSSFLQMYAEGSLLATDTVPVRSKDKLVRQLTRAQVRVLLQALVNFVQTQYQWSWDQKAAIGQ